MNSLILSIETATLGGGVCVSAGDRILAAVAGDPKLSHSNTLLSDIDKCLREAGAAVQDVQLFAATCGPGSFTGLRIGLATIKALAATLNRPCVGIPTLQVIAHTAGLSRATVALLPAGRGEVFVQSVSVARDITELDAAAHLPPASAIERYKSLPALKWVGPGAAINRDLIESTAREQGFAFQVTDVNDTEMMPEGWQLVARETNLANHVAAIAWQRFQRQELEQAESLSAIYVRPSDAELKCNPA
ncbi:MAG TPA: tRNA (adenosine(37)-N6)-threonylcarbamoyltransferase complex dimerization subunit type 1 TsaB [Pyrinomonadaceae bacterium]|nr:tRNA (adenosine(37)-N6)-threonylcarbamoyltransferase complex dimerization subunit type 1 TsaB [Pyrinomonadaceae bacterium]